MIPERERIQLITFWREDAHDTWTTAWTLWKKQRYAHGLFFAHLAVEKLLKARVVERTGEHPPYSHDLADLATKGSIALTKTRTTELETITTFNISARYDTIKRSFSARATRPYARQWINTAREIFLWLDDMFQKK